MEHVEAWMDSNKLQLDQIGAMVVGTRSRTSVYCNEHLGVGGSLIPLFSVQGLKVWEVVLDSSLTMPDHISSVCRSVCLELGRISAVRPFCSTSATATLVCSRVLSRIDYCNSLLAGITSDQTA